MTRNSVSALLLLGLVLLGLLIWGLYVSIESYEETEHSSWSSEALRNPYLGAQHFMEQSGIGVTDVDTLVKIDQFDNLGTLFFSDANQVQTPRQLKQVMEWLQAGGNVIYTANDVEHEDDLLLQELGVEVEWRERESGDDGEGDSDCCPGFVRGRTVRRRRGRATKRQSKPHRRTNPRADYRPIDRTVRRRVRVPLQRRFGRRQMRQA